MRQRNDNGLRAQPKLAGSSQIHPRIETEIPEKNRASLVNLSTQASGKFPR
jgi:hypothetical protein